jgi:hypothetical protein
VEKTDLHSSSSSVFLVPVPFENVRCEKASFHPASIRHWATKIMLSTSMDGSTASCAEHQCISDAATPQVRDNDHDDEYDAAAVGAGFISSQTKKDTERNDNRFMQEYYESAVSVYCPIGTTEWRLSRETVSTAGRST